MSALFEQYRQVVTAAQTQYAAAVAAAQTARVATVQSFIAANQVGSIYGVVPGYPIGGDNADNSMDLTPNLIAVSAAADTAYFAAVQAAQGLMQGQIGAAKDLLNSSQAQDAPY